MDERRLKMIRAAAEFAGISIKDYDALDNQVEDLIDLSNRYLRVFCIPGAIACVGHASFLAHVFGAQDNRAFMGEKFTDKEGHGFWKAYRHFSTEKANEADKKGLNMLENMALGMMVAIANGDGDVDKALRDATHSIGETMDFFDAVAKATALLAIYMETSKSMSSGEVLSKVNRRFIDTYLRFINEVRDLPECQDIFTDMTKPLAAESPTATICSIIGSIVIAEVETDIPLEYFEDFWNMLKSNDDTGTMDEYTQKAQEFFTRLDKDFNTEGQDAG